MINLDWTEARDKQLCLLIDLLSKVSLLNINNNHLKNTQECIDIAEKLLLDDTVNSNVSFQSFLVNLSLQDGRSRANRW